ncbi:hypothetical protein [Rhodovulum sulfidophilum]|uniref:hypothetical protein n=1 Tax=Rhodovulum sulfidophilum TaxID=35806 RepID=UPI001921C28D|nr:hypothetical protein [Rhodovulum sulfidophilum]MBL3576069.1 hypothetical protein [Rhodovulum sulfidophilum]MCE8433177.1 hypothetical protein [Rhodovulum sulfidophilum]
MAAVLAPGSADAQSVIARWIAEHAPFAVAETKPVALESWLQTGGGNWDLLATLPELTAEVPVRVVAAGPRAGTGGPARFILTLAAANLARLPRLLAI